MLEVPLHRELGLRLIDADSAHCGVELEVGRASVNNADVLHGGLVPLILDVAAYLAVLPRLDPAQNAVTVSVDASLLAPARPGATVRASATVERFGRSLAFLNARLVEGDRLLATGQVVKAVLRTGG